jgi:hypothetical protein
MYAYVSTAQPCISVLLPLLVLWLGHYNLVIATLPNMFFAVFAHPWLLPYWAALGLRLRDLIARVKPTLSVPFVFLRSVMSRAQAWHTRLPVRANVTCEGTWF